MLNSFFVIHKTIRTRWNKYVLQNHKWYNLIYYYVVQLRRYIVQTNIIIEYFIFNTIKMSRYYHVYK